MALKTDNILFRPIGGKKKQDAIPKHFPVKRTINLVTVGEKPLNIKLAIPGIVLIIFAATLFGKFAVADRLIAVSRAQHEAEVVRTQLDAGYQKIEEYGDLSEEYAHYTYSGMTVEELARADRNKVLDLIERIILPEVVVSSWSIQDNQVTLVIGSSTLQQINLLVQRLETDEMVDFCTVETASTNTGKIGNGLSTNSLEAVTAQLTIYLNSGLEEDE